MKTRLFGIAGAVLLAAWLPLTAHDAKQPKPKTKKEQEALMQVQSAAQGGNAAAELAAISNVLENFADTEFKPQLLSMAMDAARATGDDAQVQTWAERNIDNDPNSIVARVTVAETTAGHIRENDLDKADSIKKVNDVAHKALDLIKSGGTQAPGVPDDKWPEYKKELTGRAWSAIALAAAADKKYADAVTDYKMALDEYPNPITAARLAKAYVDNRQWDDAIAAADKAMAMPDISPAVKKFSQDQKDIAAKMKAPH